MEMLNVQFSDSTEQAIVSYFSAPQDPEVYANLGTVTTSDARWAAYYNSFPKWAAPAIQESLPAPTA